MEAVHIYENQREKLLSLLTEFEDPFNGKIGKLDTTPIDLEVKTGSKPFNARYYMFPRTNKETLRKDLQRLVEIGVLSLCPEVKI